jgi:hypothetical protein
MNLTEIAILQEQYIIESANNMTEMANLFTQDTGVPYAMWFGEVGGQHGPRIKVSNIKGKMSPDCFVVSVSKTPGIMTPRSVKISQTDITDVMDWIIINYDILMQMWNAYESGNGLQVATLTLQLKKI